MPSTFLKTLLFVTVLKIMSILKTLYFAVFGVGSYLRFTSYKTKSFRTLNATCFDLISFDAIFFYGSV